MANPTDEQVRAYIDSVPGLRKEWGIASARRLGSVCFVLMSVLLIALAIGTIAYLAFASPDLARRSVSGLIIVIVLAYVACGLRIFQLRAERAELPAFRKALAAGLTGDPATDTQAQTRIETDFTWKSLHYRNIARLIGIAALIIIAINTYQIGVLDYARTLLFDGVIIVYLAGAFWNNFAFKAGLLEVELEERSRATIRWQTEHHDETA